MTQVSYPQVAVDNDIQGKVFLSFIVDVDGSVIEVTLLRGVNKHLDDAALKHLRNMPSFLSPGFQRGKPVKVKYNIPVNFQLSGDEYVAPLTKKEIRQYKKYYKKKSRAQRRK